MNPLIDRQERKCPFGVHQCRVKQPCMFWDDKTGCVFGHGVIVDDDAGDDDTENED